MRTLKQYFLLSLLLFPAIPTYALTLVHSAAGTYRDQAGPSGTIGTGDGFFSELSVFQAGNFPNAGPVGVEDRGFVEFDISSAPMISSAILTFTLARNDGSLDNTYQVYGYSGDGVVNLSSGDFNAGSLVGGFVVGSQARGTTFSVDVTSIVMSLISNNDTHAGFGLRSLPQSSFNEFELWGVGPQFASEANPLSPFPTLTLTPVPLPAAAWLFLTAIGGLFGMRKLKAS